MQRALAFFNISLINILLTLKGGALRFKVSLYYPITL
jgi:hypothetical protein